MNQDAAIVGVTVLLMQVAFGIWALMQKVEPKVQNGVRVEFKSLLASIVPALVFLFFLQLYHGGGSSTAQLNGPSTMHLHFMWGTAWLLLFPLSLVVCICHLMWIAKPPHPRTNWQSMICRILGLAVAIAALRVLIEFAPDA